jgi:Zn-dependent M16 (insulinase) family peptidase
MASIHGFEVLREQPIRELNTKARLFRHVKTGAQLLSMENDDENKVFGITFFTPPPDNTGLTHILEHSVLCGSRKYPLKEPFVELIKGSLATFVNAMTFPDKTTYPVASQNVRDFYNLIDVYLDAVFYPRITPKTLQQEGWHYELENTDAQMVYKGVVFNEMKGAYSSPDSVNYRYAKQSLYPGTIYGWDSGGDPTAIPDLTYETFKKFHETYYHPSNAFIYFYGDDDPDERLRCLDSWLQDFEPLALQHTVTPPVHFDKPHRVTQPYSVAAENGGAAAQAAQKAFVTLNWLMAEPSDTETTLGLEILAHVLVGTPASPLRKALIDSGLGEDLTGAGMDSDLNPTYFSTGLKGVAVENTDKVEPLVMDTLAVLARDGIENEMIEASLNTIEFRLREQNTGSYPRGLFQMLSALSTWLHGADPLAPLAFEAPLTNIRARVVNGERYFEDLIKRFMLDNTHRSTLILTPDPQLNTRNETAENERLAAARAAMNADQLHEVVGDTLELKRLQSTPDSPEALASIPTLTLADLDKKIKTIPLAVSEEQGTQVLYHDLFTNGILYLDLGLDLHALPQEYLPYVGLFSEALLKLGTQKEDFVKLSQRIGRTTGGIHTSSITSMTRDGGNQYQAGSAAWLFLRGKSTTAQADELLAILRDVLLTVKLDNRERFRQIVLEEKAGLEARLVPAGHVMANTRLKSAFNEADWAAEKMGGISYLLFLRGLLETVDKDWQSVLDKLETIRHMLLNRGTMLANVTLDSQNYEQFRPKLAGFLASLPMMTLKIAAWSPDYGAENEGLTIPAQVSYVAKGANLYKLGYKHHGSAAVIRNFLRTTWLWERVRVQGGAYGGMCEFDHLSGVFSFLSYRDPNLLGTIDNYDAAAKFLREADLGEQTITRSVIGAIGRMDTYQLPDAKGYTSMVRYLVGENDERLQQRRQEILSTSAHDFHTMADALDALSREGRVAVVGSQAAIDAANAQRGGDWLRVTKVL